MFLRILWYSYQIPHNDWLKPSELTALQEKRLKALLKHAYENVPLYHQKFDSAGIKPEDIRTLEDVSKIPFTTKQEINSRIPDRSISKAYRIQDCIRIATSGTTGGRMPVYCDKRYWDYRIASMHYFRPKRVGLSPWEKTM